MKKLFLISLTVMGAAATKGQSIDRTVIACTGGYATTASAQLSYTVGEVAIQYLSVSGGPSVSQGFQQSSNGSTSIQSLGELNVKLSAFPNPFANIIEVKTDKSLDGVSFRLCDAMGKMISVQTTEMNKGKHWKIETGTLASGTYWLTVATSTQQSSYSLMHFAN